MPLTLTRCFLCLIALAVSCAVLTFSAPARADPPPLAGKRVLFLGDSITQHGRYITLLEYYLDKRFPGSHFEFFSLGLSSETVSGLSEKAHPFPRPYVHERLWAALDLVKPDVVFACYGMNDGIYHPQSQDRMAAFQAGIKKLLAVCKAAHAQVILLTPPPFDPLPVSGATRPDGADDYSYMNPYAHYDSVLNDYAQWEKTLPAADAQVIDLHAPLLQYLMQQRRTNPKFSFSPDGIHPSPVGHLLMAQTILTSLGLPTHSDDLNKELAAVQADPLYALVEHHNSLRADGWTPYVGYTRGDSVKTFSIENAEQEAAAVQSKIDQLRSAGVP